MKQVRHVIYFGLAYVSMLLGAFWLAQGITFAPPTPASLQPPLAPTMAFEHSPSSQIYMCLREETGEKMCFYHSPNVDFINDAWGYMNHAQSSLVEVQK